ncbi:hypothetical protein N0O92_07120 [Alkalihalobacillus sp. MEB130]|uniref:hypothetical protein n=1 Tax=Alkalihalobacillus sp. MEB130 TaxID=2976704 RepID=UPI0028DECA1F|nr:hypothetical protein [Alkalihalobacillus sp. MEB130]MDT8860000.1 hypothetical protein [Alkalihalobacillus sp. MEB130]
MYLLDKATKIDEERNEMRSYLIDDGQINYVTNSFGKWNKQRVDMSGTLMTNGRIMYDNELINCEDFQAFQDRQSYLIKKGCTGVAVAPEVKYECDMEAVIKRAKHAMASSTLDYVVGLTFSATLLRPEVLRKCQNLRIPFVRVVIQSFEQIRTLPWTHLSQALLTYPTVLIPEIAPDSKRLEAVLLKEWVKNCSEFQIHTSEPLDILVSWKKSLLQKVGLYPLKGVLLSGSDADYLLFTDDRNERVHAIDQKVAPKETIVYHEREPVIVVIKGEIVKANETISLKPGYGRLIDINRPGRFLSLSDLSDSTEQQVSLM